MDDWTKLPEELLLMITVRLFSVVELLRFRSICQSWRASISITDNNNNNPFPLRPNIHLNPLIITVSTTQQANSSLDLNACISRAAFFRVTHSSMSQSWLIKSEPDYNYGTLRLLNPLSRLPLLHWYKSIDLYQFTLSGIQESYVLQNQNTKETLPGFKRLVLVSVSGQDPKIVGIGCDGKIRYWNGVIWTRIKDQTSHFSDVIVHKGLVYALDVKGIVWLVSHSLSIFKYGPLLDSECHRAKRFVECSGELYIVDCIEEADSSPVTRFSHVIHDDVGNMNCELSERDCDKMVGFKVYKVDEELREWVEVKSLGDNAIVMANDCCFSVLANEFYGCLQNSIYFSDKEEVIKVYKLDDGSITTMKGFSQSCFQMFVPSFR
ncbi:hypothetical protein AALP_AA3G336500 [Arabis alpina]|uniref:KIB1-4 beta-propeller domain-containing protein n=1 Tax=Arabis alpina TaxID=50452 RepID=A0A087HDE4_ARAAL|nr:hypothetical protein AALP_AA3G336500 [Arabis alpina]